MFKVSPRIFSGKLSFVVFLFLIAVSANIIAFKTVIRQPFNLDEFEESRMGWKFSQIGPRAFLDVPEGGECISHPLLYTFSHAAIQKVFGPEEVTLRLYGVSHYLISLFLVFLIARKLIGTDTFGGRLGIAISCMMFISNPLLVQHSIIVNSDNNILTTMMLIFIYFFVSYEKVLEHSRKTLVISRIKLGIIFALCLWAKIIAPALMLAGLVFSRILNRQNEKTLADILGIAVFGTGVFWLTWYIYCVLTGTDLFAFINFTFVGKGSIVFSARHMDSIQKIFLASFRWPIYWVSAPFFILLIGIMLNRAFGFIKKKKLAVADMILLSSVFVWVPFQFIKPNIDMMKYQYPAYPLFFIVIGYVVSRVANGVNKEDIFFFGKVESFLIPLGGLLIYHYYKLGDYILVLIRPMSSFLNGHFLVYYYLPVFLVIALTVMASNKKNRMVNIVIAFVFFVITVNSALLVNQAKADYITAEVYRNYGEKGFRETVTYLQNKIDSGMVIAARWDIIESCSNSAEGEKRNFPAIPGLITDMDENEFRKFISDPKLGYIVLDQVFPPIMFGQKKTEMIFEYFVLEKNIGSFFVLRKK